MENNQNKDISQNITQNVYINSVLDSISNFIDKKEIIPPEKIIVQKNKFLEKNQLQEQNLIKIQQKLQQTEFLKQEIEIEKDKNKQLSISNNNKDIQIKQLTVNNLQNKILNNESFNNTKEKIQQPLYQQQSPQQVQELHQQSLPYLVQNKSFPQSPPPQNHFPHQHQYEIQQQPQNYNVIMDKLNEIVSIFNEKQKTQKEITNPWTGQLFDEHSKILINKRIADMDEKLYDIAKKINQTQMNNQSINTPQVPNIIPIYQPFNPYLNYNQNLPSNLQTNIQTNLQESPPVNSINNINKEEVKISEIELNSVLSTPSINNNTSTNKRNIKENKKKENNTNIRFKTEKSPFQYIYNNTNDLIFEKTNILNGGNKLEKFKKNRLVKLF